MRERLINVSLEMATVNNCIFMDNDNLGVFNV